MILWILIMHNFMLQLIQKNKKTALQRMHILIAVKKNISIRIVLQTHNMNFQNMILKQMQSFFDIIWALQTEVTDLKASHTLIFSSSQENLISIMTTKSEKLSDLLMFEDNQKKLCSFITKLCLKLQENADRHFIE